MKQFCTVHCFSYSSSVCPFCEKDRINRLAHRFVKTIESNVVNDHNNKKEIQREITENDLKKLMDKFNSKNHK